MRQVLRSAALILTLALVAVVCAVRSRHHNGSQIENGRRRRGARFSSATARCPREINPIDRRSTTSAVSMIDPAVHSTTKSTGGTGDWVLAKYTHLVDQNVASWNHVREWLSRLDAVSRASAPPA